MNRLIIADLAEHGWLIWVCKKTRVVAVIWNENISTRQPGRWAISSRRIKRTDMCKRCCIININLRKTVSIYAMLQAVLWMSIFPPTSPAKKAIGSPAVERTDVE